MTALLPARAPAPHGQARSTPTRRRLSRLFFATVLVAAGLAWPATPYTPPTTTGRPATATAAAIRARDPSHETEPRPDRFAARRCPAPAARPHAATRSP